MHKVAVLNYLIDECQSAPFASKRAIANTRKYLVLIVAVMIKLGNYPSAFALTVPIDGIENETPYVIQILKIFWSDVLENVGNGK